MLEAVGINDAAAADPLLSPRILRRHAPAGDDRDGADHPPGAPDRRRAHDRARRDGAGPDPRADPQTAAGARDGGHLRHPRPRGRRRPLRPRAGDVRRPDHGDRRRAGPSSTRPLPSLHAGPCSARSRRCSRRAGSSTRSRGCRPTSPSRSPGCAFAPRCEFAAEPCTATVPDARGGRPRATAHACLRAPGGRDRRPTPDPMDREHPRAAGREDPLPDPQGLPRASGRRDRCARSTASPSRCARARSSASSASRAAASPPSPARSCSSSRRRAARSILNGRNLGQASRRRDARLPARPADDLPGPLRLAEPEDDRLRDAGGAAPRPRDLRPRRGPTRRSPSS